MPRYNFYIYKWLISLIVAFILSLTAAIPAYAEAGLWNLIDLLNTNKASAVSTHAISFTLPSNSLPVYHSDYIHIYLGEYSNVTAPTMLTGSYSGLPVYSIDDHWVHITGIAIQAGAAISIHGITTTNPPVLDDYEISVLISEDLGRTLRKNGANTMATLFRGHVSVSATIEANLASLQISGYTAPDTFVIFTEGAAVIGTDVAGPTGYYSHIFSGLQPTTHHLTFYGIDTLNRTTSPVNIEIYTPAKQLTSVSGMLLSPTVQLLADQFNQGEPITASGSAMPNGDITIFTDSPLRTYYSSASANGSWTYTITNSSEFLLGDYRYYTLVQDHYGLQSLISNTHTFSVVSTTGGGTSCGDITQGDLNCDGNVDLTDFSILMYYWGSANAAADCNGDFMVNLTDFSIIMYFWGT